MALQGRRPVRHVTRALGALVDFTDMCKLYLSLIGTVVDLKSLQMNIHELQLLANHRAQSV